MTTNTASQRQTPVTYQKCASHHVIPQQSAELPTGRSDSHKLFSSDFRATAHQLHQLGFNVNLLGSDKNPIHKWKSTPDYTTARQTERDFARLPWNGYTRKTGEVVPPPVGVAGINGIGDLRTLDLDKRADPELVTLVLAAMDLPADYGWVTLSGSHRGNGIAVRCAEDIPESLLPYFIGTTSKILVGTPRDGVAAFKQLELRYSGCQTVMPPSLHPSGNYYEWLHGEPQEPPAIVTFEQLLAGFLAIAELPKLPEPKPVTNKYISKVSPGEAANERQNARDVIDRLNGANDLGDYLESRGCTLVAKRGDVRYYSGMAGDGHTSKYTYVVSPATSGSGHIGFSYSTHGKFNKGDYPRGFKWFDAVCALEYSGNTLDTLKTLNPIEPRKNQKDKNVFLIEPETRYTDEQRAAWKARKNEAHSTACADLHERVRQQIAHDNDAPGSERAVVRVMVEWMVEHNSMCCWLGRASIARRSGYSYGAVKRAVMNLEARGYFVSEGKGGRSIDTARRNFSRGSLFATQNVFVPKDDPRMVITSNTHVLDQELVRGRPPQQPEPEAWETWEATDSEACGYDLALELVSGTYVEPIEAVNVPKKDIYQVVNLEKSQVLSAGWCKMQPDFDDSAEPECAVYDPDSIGLHNWTDPTAMRMRETAHEVNGGIPPLTSDDPEPLVLGPPTDPDTLSKYYALRGKARKATSDKQRFVLNRQAEALMVWRPARDVAPRGSAWPTAVSQSPPVLPPAHKLEALTLPMDLSQPPAESPHQRAKRIMIERSIAAGWAP